jgi:hypothetical protein
MELVIWKSCSTVSGTDSPGSSKAITLPIIPHRVANSRETDQDIFLYIAEKWTKEIHSISYDHILQWHRQSAETRLS